MKLFIIPLLIFASTPTLASPYILSKTEVRHDSTSYDGTTTELRVGYEKGLDSLFTKGTSVYAEFGPGYEWEFDGNQQPILVYEVGVKGDISENIEGKVKYEGGYGLNSNTFGGKVEIEFQYNFK